MKGYTGKLLRIDLNERKIAVEKITEKLAREYLGGRGWGAKILFDELDSRIDPFSPENKIIVSTGPLNGTGAHSFSKCCINSISALTGGCNRSMVGGHFAAELKFAGWDGI
jgi:aldehyde:ferredoxin oxidoreductase